MMSFFPCSFLISWLSPHFPCGFFPQKFVKEKINVFSFESSFLKSIVLTMLFFQDGKAKQHYATLNQ